MLPPLPRIELRVARDRTNESRASGGFLDVRRLDLVTRTPGGQDSRVFAYDVATRAALDAVVMAAHHVERGTRRVFLRSALRPPLALRAIDAGGVPDAPSANAALWELPAGLIEPGEIPSHAAARELAEELGFDVDPSTLAPLGHATFPAPGFIAEKHYFFHVEVDPSRRRAPTEDGSVLEKDAAIVDIPLREALEHCRSGLLPDAKTELALRRLAEIVG